MEGKTKEEVIMERFSEIVVYLNRRSQQIVEVTCARKLHGGWGQPLPFSSEQDSKRVLLAFGIEEASINAGLNRLREVNLREIKPLELVCLGEFRISTYILAANGFTIP